MKIRSVYILILFLTIPLCAFSQGYFNQWYFGNGASIDFTSGIPVVTNNGSLHTIEGCATVSDFQGNLLFYTDGDTIWNKLHQPMPNGTGLMGNWSSSQSAIIVQIPGDSLKYYVFTMQDWLASGDLRYSIVDITLDNGNGAVLPQAKNVLLGTNFTEKLTSISDDCGVWIVTHKRNNNEFYSYYVDALGISSPVISNSGSVHTSIGNPNALTGTMKVSSNNQKIALTTLTGILEVFDFNSSTGSVSNPITLPIAQGWNGYGVCFSPNSNVLYSTEGDGNNFTPGTKIYQYDLSSGVPSIIAGSKTFIANASMPLHIISEIQLGPDNKLYITRQNTSYLDVINSPDIIGTGCNYSINGVNIGAVKVTSGLPAALKFALNPTQLDLGNDMVFCQPQPSIQLNAAQAVSYLWSTGSTGPTINASVPGTYWVQVSNNVCTNSDTITLSYNSAPIVNLGNDTAICQGETITLNAGTAGSYLWSNGSTSSFINVSVSDTYWVQASNGPCSAIDSINIVVNPAPQVDLGNDTTLCQGQTLTLTPGIGVSYLWSDSSTGQFININNSGIYWVEVSNSQCTSTDSINVMFFNTPSVQLGNDTTFCQGGTVTLTSGPATSYLWSNGSTFSSINVSTSGTYWVQASNGPCMAVDSINIIVHPLPQVDLGNDIQACQGQTITLNAGIGYYYLWSDGTTGSSTIVSSSGNYWVQVSDTQCSTIDSINLTFNSIPSVDLGSDTSICQGEEIILFSDPATSFLWSNGATMQSISVSTPGDYWVQASNGPCASIDSITITTIPVPMTELGADTVICEGQSVLLSAGSATTYTWSSASASQTIEVTTEGTYWIEASNEQCTSSDTITIIIENCDIEIIFPNVFTPNGDGLNDFFVPVIYNGIKKGNLKIYNRWGNELYSTVNLSSGWDGYHNGALCSEGTYFFIAEYTTRLKETKSIRGVVTLVK